MPHAGYADPITNDGPRFYSIISGKELPEPITRTIEVNPMPKSIEQLQAATERWVTLNLCTISPINFAIEPSTPATAGVGPRSGAGNSVYSVDIPNARSLLMLKN